MTSSERIGRAAPISRHPQTGADFKAPSTWTISSAVPDNNAVALSAISLKCYLAVREAWADSLALAAGRARERAHVGARVCRKVRLNRTRSSSGRHASRKLAQVNGSTRKRRKDNRYPHPSRGTQRQQDSNSA